MNLAQTKAKQQLDKMRASLAEWLKLRLDNDAAASGTLVGPVTPAHAREIVAASRDLNVEARLATQLHTLLRTIAPDEPLPGANEPDAAVRLAQLVVNPPMRKSPTGFIPLLIIAGAVMLVLMSKISSDADVAKEREKYACIQSGRCTDTGFWFKWIAIGVGAWFVWTKTGVGEQVKGLISDAGWRARSRVRG